MTVHYSHSSFFSNIPQLDRGITTPYSQVFPIASPGHRGDIVILRVDSSQFMNGTILGIPEEHLATKADRQDIVFAPVQNIEIVVVH
jgi:hypothetical protein